jgi:hypothetical protein
LFGHIVEPIEDAIFYFSDNIVNSDARALITKICTAFVSCPGRIEGAIMSQNVKGNHFQPVKDTHQHMEDFVVQRCSQPGSEVGKGCLTGNMGIDACKQTIRPAPMLITQDFTKPAHLFMVIDMAKQVEQK